MQNQKHGREKLRRQEYLLLQTNAQHACEYKSCNYKTSHSKKIAIDKDVEVYMPKIIVIAAFT